MTRDNQKVFDFASLQYEEAKRIDGLANQFAAMVPELVFSPAEILSFLIKHRQSTREAISKVEIWMTRIMEQREAKNGV